MVGSKRLWQYIGGELAFELDPAYVVPEEFNPVSRYDMYLFCKGRTVLTNG